MRQFRFQCMFYVVLALLLFAASDGVSADNKWSVITTPELKTLVDKGEDLVLVYTMPKIFNDLRHIEGSICIPLSKLKTSPDMPADKEKLIVFYCLGPA